MGSRTRKAVLVTFLIALPQISWAGGYHYTHKAGVSRLEWDADQKVCIEAGKAAGKNPGAPSPYNPVTQSTVAGAAGAGFAEGFMRGMMRRKAMYGTYYRCLKAHGYVERELAKDEAKAVRALKGKANADKVYEMGTAPNPPHPIMPEDQYD
jgi:hypothetical protein